jgi:hypothetical protein
MIRGLLVTAVISFVVAVAAITGAAAIGGPRWGDGFFNGFSDDDDKAGEIAGGADIVRSYAWTGGEALMISAPAEVVYTQGNAAKVTISGPEGLLNRVTVADGEIVLKGRVNGRNGLKIAVEAPAVKSFRFNGGQDIDIVNYAQDRLSIEVNGAAKVEAQGSARTIDLRANGASDIDLSEVANDEAKVELNGASNASLAPKSSVDIRINGVGNVWLATKPLRMNKEIHGLGGVSYRTDEPKGKATPPPSLPMPAPGSREQGKTV